MGWGLSGNKPVFLMSLGTYFLTALRESPQKNEDRAVPRVVSLDVNDEIKVIPITDDEGRERAIVKHYKTRVPKTYSVLENLGEITMLRDFENAASSPYNTGTKASIAAAGSVQASGATSDAYHVTITAATASTAKGIRLPNATGSRNVVAFVNDTAVDVHVYPAVSTQTLNGVTAATGATAGLDIIPAGQSRHFYRASTTGWVTCKGPHW